MRQDRTQSLCRTARRTSAVTRGGSLRPPPAEARPLPDEAAPNTRNPFAGPHTTKTPQTFRLPFRRPDTGASLAASPLTSYAAFPAAALFPPVSRVLDDNAPRSPSPVRLRPPTGLAGRRNRGGSGGIIPPENCLFCLFCLSCLSGPGAVREVRAGRGAGRGSR